MFSDRLKELRARYRISQAELASKLGVAQQTVASWETDKSSPNYSLLTKIAQIFNVSSDYMLGLSDYMRIAEVHGSGDRVDVYAEVDGDKSPSYYHDPEVAQIAQAMHDAPGMRVMFDASRRLSKESIEEVQNFIKFQLAKEGKL